MNYEGVCRTAPATPGLSIILDDNYVDYPAALEMTALDDLLSRRQRRCLSCNMCNEGFDKHDKIKKHIKEDHKDIIIQRGMLRTLSIIH